MYPTGFKNRRSAQEKMRISYAVTEKHMDRFLCDQ